MHIARHDSDEDINNAILIFTSNKSLDNVTINYIFSNKLPFSILLLKAHSSEFDKFEPFIPKVNADKMKYVFHEHQDIDKAKIKTISNHAYYFIDQVQKDHTSYLYYNKKIKLLDSLKEHKDSMGECLFDNIYTYETKIDPKKCLFLPNFQCQYIKYYDGQNLNYFRFYHSVATTFISDVSYNGKMIKKNALFESLISHIRSISHKIQNATTTNKHFLQRDLYTLLKKYIDLSCNLLSPIYIHFVFLEGVIQFKNCLDDKQFFYLIEWFIILFTNIVNESRKIHPYRNTMGIVKMFGLRKLYYEYKNGKQDIGDRHKFINFVYENFSERDPIKTKVIFTDKTILTDCNESLHDSFKELQHSIRNAQCIIPNDEVEKASKLIYNEITVDYILQISSLDFSEDFDQAHTGIYNNIANQMLHILSKALHDDISCETATKLIILFHEFRKNIIISHEQELNTGSEMLLYFKKSILNLMKYDLHDKYKSKIVGLYISYLGLFEVINVVYGDGESILNNSLIFYPEFFCRYAPLYVSVYGRSLNLIQTSIQSRKNLSDQEKETALHNLQQFKKNVVSCQKEIIRNYLIIGSIVAVVIGIPVAIIFNLPIKYLSSDKAGESTLRSLFSFVFLCIIPMMFFHNHYYKSNIKPKTKIRNGSSISTFKYFIQLLNIYYLRLFVFSSILLSLSIITLIAQTALPSFYDIYFFANTQTQSSSRIAFVVISILMLIFSISYMIFSIYRGVTNNFVFYNKYYSSNEILHHGMLLPNYTDPYTKFIPSDNNTEFFIHNFTKIEEEEYELNGQILVPKYFQKESFKDFPTEYSEQGICENYRLPPYYSEDEPPPVYFSEDEHYDIRNQYTNNAQSGINEKPPEYSFHDTSLINVTEQKINENINSLTE